MATNQEAWVSAKDIGLRLSLNTDTVQLYARQWRIPFMRISPRVIRFQVSSVMAALERSQQVTVDDGP